jgi:hypothetical protein
MNAYDYIPDVPKYEPCYIVNPALWMAYCYLRGRDPYPLGAEHWTEADIVMLLEVDSEHNNVVYTAECGK